MDLYEHTLNLELGDFTSISPALNNRSRRFAVSYTEIQTCHSFDISDCHPFRIKDFQILLSKSS